MVHISIPVVASFFVPGLGQAILGETKKGILFIIGGFLFLGILYFVFSEIPGYTGSNLTPALMGGIIYAILSSLDAYKLSEK